MGANVYYNHDVGLASEQHVCYRVIAFNGPSESGPSNMDCTTPPAGPTALTAIALDETWSQIELAWTDNSAVEDGYVVWFYWVWEDGSIFWETIGVPANSTRLVTSNLGCEYYVVAWKDGGSSDRSNYVRTPASSAACF